MLEPPLVASGTEVVHNFAHLLECLRTKWISFSKGDHKPLPLAWILDVARGALKQVSKSPRKRRYKNCPKEEEAIRFQRASMIRGRGADVT